MSLPLAILAVRGWRRLRLPRAAAVAAIAVVTLPGLAFTVDFLRQTTAGDDRSLLLRPEEARALRYLDAAPGGGGVLASPRIASAVPAFTGRRTWVGHPTWTPGFDARVRQDLDLFAGRLTGARARALVRAARVRWVLSDCAGNRDLRAALGPLLVRVRRFGCATVYELRARGPAAAL
jgi:hypothetical protein